MGSFLESLVDDVIIQVFSVLSVCDLLSLRQTSKRMEMHTHIRSVWHNIFKREVLDLGRPLPGCSFSLTPRLLALCGVVSEEDFVIKFSDAPMNDALVDLLESWDLEARSLHALRLEKRWKAALAESKSEDMKFGQHPASTRSTFRTSLPVSQLLLLPGGRFMVTVHQDRMQCWDLSFPQAYESGNDKNQALIKSSPTPRCIGEWVFPKNATNLISLIDEGAQTTRKSGNELYVVLCSDIRLTWGEDVFSNDRSCFILSIKDADLRPRALQPISPRGSPLTTPVPIFAQECSVSLPLTLPTPVYAVRPGESAPPEEFGPHRFTNGKLGELLQIHGTLLFFASFIPPPVDSDSPKYAGIEVLDWNADNGNVSSSVLLEYPDTQLGEFMGLYVHSSAEAVVVVWQNCLGVYPIPNFSREWVSDCSAYNRLVTMPTIIFAMSEAVAKPITFSTCSVATFETETSDSCDSPLPLTILARSRHHPSLTVQTVLTAIPGPLVASPNSTPGSRQFRFRLTRIPAPTPHFFAPLVSGQIHECEGVAALAVGPSGRGVRVDGRGAVYRCAPADVVLPRFGGFGLGDAGMGGSFERNWEADGGAADGGSCSRRGAPKRQSNLVSTVDFWPYRRIDSLPDHLLFHPPDPAAGEYVVDAGELVVRFDEGMGRMVVARLRDAAGARNVECNDALAAGAQQASEEDQACIITIFDFA